MRCDAALCQGCGFDKLGFALAGELEDAFKKRLAEARKVVEEPQQRVHTGLAGSKDSVVLEARSRSLCKEIWRDASDIVGIERPMVGQRDNIGVVSGVHELLVDLHGQDLI